MGLVLSVCLAALAAAANATASVLQRKGARSAPAGSAFRLRLLWELVQQPIWVAGVCAIIVGFLLQAGALATGPIALVQPILVLELGFTLMLASVVFGSHLHAREWAAIAGMSIGLALLLFALQPRGGNPHGAPVVAWVIGIVLNVGIAAACTIGGYRSRDARRAGFLGIAAGTLFGFTAALLAGITSTYNSDGLTGVFTSWQTYALIVFGPIGFFMLQNALGAGRLAASQPALTLSDPLVAVAWGLAVFGEHARTGWWIVVAFVGAGLIAASTALLARSPLLHGSAGKTEGEHAGLKSQDRKA